MIGWSRSWKAACESRIKISVCALIQHAGEPEDGKHCGCRAQSIAAEQAGLIEAEAQRLLDATPAWKAQIPGGVVASKMKVFPLVSDLLPRLRRDFAAAAALDPSGDPSLFQQTRIDALYFDAKGRVRVAGLCINQRAYIAHKESTAKPSEDPEQKIALGVRAFLKGYPIPEDIDRGIMASTRADMFVYEQNPVQNASAVCK